MASPIQTPSSENTGELLLAKMRSQTALEPMEVPMVKSLLSKTGRRALAPNTGPQISAGSSVASASRESNSAENHAELCLKAGKGVLKAESFKALDTKAESCFAPGGRASWLGRSTSLGALSQETSGAASGEDCSGALKDNDLVPEDQCPIQTLRCSPDAGCEESLPVLVPDIDIGTIDFDDEIEEMFPEPDEAEESAAVLGDLCMGDGEMVMLRDVLGSSWKPCATPATPPRSPSPLLAASPDLDLLDLENFDLPPFVDEALEYVPLD